MPAPHCSTKRWCNGREGGGVRPLHPQMMKLPAACCGVSCEILRPVGQSLWAACRSRYPPSPRLWRVLLAFIPAAAYSAEVATSATKAGSYGVFGEGESNHSNHRSLNTQTLASDRAHTRRGGCRSYRCRPRSHRGSSRPTRPRPTTTTNSRPTGPR